MPYTDHFRLTDDLIQHLDPILDGLNDSFIESRYTGFLAVSSVTVLELSMKTVFLEFATAKHKVLGNFCEGFFDKINGRIGLDLIKKDYIAKFGSKYLQRFTRELDILEKQHLITVGTSIKASYGNLLTWRHGFAHEGIIPANATYLEVKRSYECGKKVIMCLDKCMRR